MKETKRSPHGKRRRLCADGPDIHIGKRGPETALGVSDERQDRTGPALVQNSGHMNVDIPICGMYSTRWMDEGVVTS